MAGCRPDSWRPGVIRGRRKGPSPASSSKPGFGRRSGLRIVAAEPASAFPVARAPQGAASQHVRSGHAVTLSDTGRHGERAHCRRSVLEQPPRSGSFEARRTASSVAVILVNPRRSRRPEPSRPVPRGIRALGGPPSHPAAGIAHPPLAPNWSVPPNDQHDRTHPVRACRCAARPGATAVTSSLPRTPGM
jgi:hypothetical protein